MLFEEISRLIDEQPTKKIPFSKYMELALYHPKWGYYNRERIKIGREGDFYTSSSVGSIFGKMWATHFVKAWKELGLLEQQHMPLVVLEVGGGNGDFAKAVLEEWQSNYPEVYMRLTYYMCEQSEFHRALQKQKLANFAAVHWISDLAELSIAEVKKPTLIFSNELFDALAVERIKRVQDGFLRCWVEVKEGKLIETWLPLDHEEIYTYIEEIGQTIPIGHIIEVPIAAKQLFVQLTSLLTVGYIFTVDYGLLYDELLRPERRNGTLIGYYAHQHVTDLYKMPGEMDLTSHVHFDALISWGNEQGLTCISYSTQREWLLQEGILQQLQAHQETDPFSPVMKHNRAILQLITPGGMGDSFKVLVQKRSIAE